MREPRKRVYAAGFSCTHKLVHVAATLKLNCSMLVVFVDTTADASAGY
jgi:hypothetical protein